MLTCSFQLFSPCRNLKLPSHRPSIVCESCVYSLEKDIRARAFHIMDPKGIIEMLVVFIEERGDALSFPPSLVSTRVSLICNPYRSADTEELLCSSCYPQIKFLLVFLSLSLSVGTAMRISFVIMVT